MRSPTEAIDDPNNWPEPQATFRLFSGRECVITYECEVDWIDYVWASQLLWNTVFNSRKRKLYFRRTIRIPPREANTFVQEYLHVEIMKRTGIAPPSALHTQVDHGDGDSLNNRRCNLSWATPSQNRRTAKC